MICYQIFAFYAFSIVLIIVYQNVLLIAPPAANATAAGYNTRSRPCELDIAARGATGCCCNGLWGDEWWRGAVAIKDGGYLQFRALFYCKYAEFAGVLAVFSHVLLQVSASNRGAWCFGRAA